MSEVRLYNADCLEVLGTLDAGSIDCIATDPPYGIGDTAARARPSKWQRRQGQEAREWDRTPAHVSGLLDIADTLVIWGGNYFSLPPSRGWLVWSKPDAPPSMASVELAWTSRDMNARQITHSIGATNKERLGHPTQKPLAVMMWCLKLMDLPPGATVLDPYMGSGTTAIACMRLGLNCIGIEIDAKYHAIAERRIKAELGRHPLFDRPAPPRPDAPLPLFAVAAEKNSF